MNYSLFKTFITQHQMKLITINIFEIFMFLSLIFVLASCGQFEIPNFSENINKSFESIVENSSQDQQDLVKSHAEYVTPTRRIDASRIPIWFIDDLNFNNMDLAINRQLQYFQRFRLSGTIQFGDDIYPRSALPFALRKFQVLYHAYRQCLQQAYKGYLSSDTCIYSFYETLISQFYIYEPDVNSVNKNNPTYFTGYYSPTLLASSRKTNRFRHAVYAKPREYALRVLTRYQIDFRGLLAGYGYELFYTDDLFAIYNLHIQGGGKTHFIDGSKNFYLSYDGHNGKKRRFISRYMKRRGMIRNESSAAQKAYLKAHPERQAEIYRQSPNYVYFRASSRPPVGSIDVSVTDGRSIATSKNFYRQKGILAFIQAERPHYQTWRDTKKIRMRPFSRFVLDQSTGAAITGKARVDVYFGESQYADVAAHHLSAYGKLFFLMPKQFP